jgi:hypothetical protein
VDGGGLFDGLEVEGEEVFGCDEELVFCQLAVSRVLEKELTKPWQKVTTRTAIFDG